MTMFKNRDLAVEFDGMVAQWIRKKSDGYELGLPIGHNIVQIRRYKQTNPKSTVYIFFSTVNYHQLPGKTKQEIEDFLIQYEVPYDKLWRKKKMPRVNDIWRVPRESV